MKHILFLLLFLPVLAHAQFPASPNKIRLGNQTTADGLVVRTAASPSWTPTTVNNAWLAFDTVAVKLYYYDGGTWNEYTGGSVNIGNTDLTLTGNRRLNTGGYQLWIQDGTGAEVPYIFIGGDQVSFAASATTSVYLDSSEQRAAIIAGAVIDIDADSIRIIGTQPNDNNLNRLLAWDTITNRLKYVDKASIQSTDTNFAEDNLTFSGNRVHNLSTRTLTIADGGTYPTFQQSAATDGITLASSATDIIAQTPGLLQIENSDTITITADRIRMNAADTRIQQIPNDNALNRLAAIDSVTGRLYYIDKSSIVTTPPNTIYSDDDVIDGNRVVYIDGNNSLKFADSTDNVLFQIGVGATPYIAQAVTDGTSITNITSSAQVQEIGANGVEWVNSFTVDTSGFKITGSGLTNDNALNRILVVDSITNRIRYLDKGSISGGGGGGVTGTGTTNTLAKWTSSTALGNSLFTDDGTNSVAGGTSSFRLPNGTTAVRPGTPTAGMSRYNTSLGYPETYGASAWLQSAFPAGTTAQTLRHDGTSWVASSLLTNNGTNVTSTAAIQATAFASPTGSCAQPAGGHFASSGPTGAIEITLPLLDVTVFQMRFKVLVGSTTYGAQTFDITLYGQQAGGIAVYSQTRVHVIGGPPRYTSNVRFGHDGTKIKVWIDEIGTNWGGATTVNVVDVSFSRASGGIPTALSICTGWNVAMENSAFNTVNRTYPITYQPSRIIEVRDNAGDFDFFNEVKPVLGGAYLGTFTGAVQINLPDSTLVLPAGEVNVEISIRYTTTSVENIRELKIYAKYRYNSRSWGSSFVSPQDGAGRQLTVRLGREGTVPCIYIGETSTTWMGLGVVLSGLNTWNTSSAIHAALIQNTWGVTTEASSFSNVTQTITGVTVGALPVTSATGWVFSENLIWDNANGRLGIGTNAPARTLHVTGEARITDLTTDTPTQIVGADADGDLGAITVGTGLSLSSGTLSASLSYNFAELTVSGGSTSATAGTPERPDNDTPGSASSTIVGSFTASGSTLDYTGSAGQGKLSAVISFTTSGGGDVLVSIYREGTQIASTEMREAVNAIYTTVALPTVTTSIATNDTFELRVEPVTGSNTITVHRSTLLIEKLY